MSEPSILFETQENIAHITLNRPQTLNAFTSTMFAELFAALDTIESEKRARAIIITGAGRGFCAGQDLQERLPSSSGGKPDLGATITDQYNPLIRRITQSPIPTIAAVNGVAAGAGCGLALACDITLACHAAKFILAFANIGLVPDSGISWHLPRKIGQAKAVAMALTGEPISAEQAETIGMIWRVVSSETLADETQSLARKLANGPQLGLQRTKEIFAASYSNSLDAQLDLERDLQRELGRTKDYAEAVSAFFEKRRPNFDKR